jgi:hypothetical protein
MSRLPDEPSTWVEDPDAEEAVRDLRAQIARARAAMAELRDQAWAVGLRATDTSDEADQPR